MSVGQPGTRSGVEEMERSRVGTQDDMITGTSGAESLGA